MKTNTFFNKINQIRKDAIDKTSTAISAPTVMVNKIKQSRSNADYKVLKESNKIPKSAPDYTPDGEVTDYFKTRTVANNIRNRMSKRK